MERLKRTLPLSLLILAALAASVHAQGWAEKMFDARSYDFGTIARAAKAEIAFELTNLYLEEVHIASVRSSCGCTTPRIEKDTLKSYEEGAIVAHINSDRFPGQRPFAGTGRTACEGAFDSRLFPAQLAPARRDPSALSLTPWPREFGPQSSRDRQEDGSRDHPSARQHLSLPRQLLETVEYIRFGQADIFRSFPNPTNRGVRRP
jgi:hypothetical protein